MDQNKKVLRPVSQKSVYHSAGDVYQRVMNGEISVDIANVALKALNVQCRVIEDETKMAIMKGQTEIRSIEMKSYESYNGANAFDRAIYNEEENETAK